MTSEKEEEEEEEREKVLLCNGACPSLPHLLSECEIRANTEQAFPEVGRYDHPIPTLESREALKGLGMEEAWVG